jgi:putative hydrolase of the HAD superfamily
MTIRAVLFDIGGVLHRNKDARLRRKWEKRLDLPKGQLAEIVFTNAIAHQATVGKAHPEDVWREVGQRLSLSPQMLTEIKADFWIGGEWNLALFDFIRSIKPNYKTGTISDAWLDARQNVKEYINHELFDVMVFSSEVGIMKPEPEIYQHTLSQLEISADESIFIDDRQKNVEGAQRIGMHSILFTKSEQTIIEILGMLQKHKRECL